jgi:hypothetical protein
VKPPKRAPARFVRSAGNPGGEFVVEQALDRAVFAIGLAVFRKEGVAGEFFVVGPEIEDPDRLVAVGGGHGLNKILRQLFLVPFSGTVLAGDFAQDNSEFGDVYFDPGVEVRIIGLIHLLGAGP